MSRYGPIRSRARRACIVALLLVAYMVFAPLVSGAVVPPVAGVWRSVSVNLINTCAIATDGTAWCWGWDLNGQLGTAGSGSQSGVPVPVDTDGSRPDTYKQISAASPSHTCAIAVDNTAWCWGNNYYGQLGNGVGGAESRSNVPVPVDTEGPRPDTYKQIAVGANHTCAIATDDTAWCWGSNGLSALGNSSAGLYEYRPVAVSTADGRPSEYESISAGEGVACAVAAGGSAWCWGTNVNGALGTGGAPDVPGTEPVAVDTTGDRPDTYAQIVVSNGGHVCGVSTDSAAWCWGPGQDGQLGDGEGVDRFTPTKVSAPPSTFGDLSGGWYGSCGLAVGGAAWCWGSGSYGFLGNVSGENSLVPGVVDTVGDRPDAYEQIASGGLSTCAIAKSDNTLWCWGWNQFGNLGDGSVGGSSAYPVQVLGGSTGICDPSDRTTACHDVVYEILSARSIALESSEAIDFGRVRQGHTAYEFGPDVYYATTWTGDAITVDISDDSQLGVKLLFDVLSIADPTVEPECVAAGSDETSVAAELSTTASAVITAIDSCGVPGATDGTDGATATTEFTVDATGATQIGTDYTVPVATTVTYTIDAG